MDETAKTLLRLCGVGLLLFLAIGAGLAMRHSPPSAVDTVDTPCVTGRVFGRTPVERCLVHPGATAAISEGVYVYCICPQDEGRLEVRR